MFEQLAFIVNPVQLIVFFTLLVVWFNSDRQKMAHRMLLCIIFISAANEIITTIYILRGWHYGLIYAPASALHNIFWLLLLHYLFGHTAESRILIKIYVGLCTISIIMVALGYSAGNSFIFIAGGFIYLYFLAKNIIVKLHSEDFSLIHSNQSLLLYAPVVFFIGFSFILAFQSNALADLPIAGKYNLYDIISCFVNIIYYMLINFYIYREKKITNA